MRVNIKHVLVLLRVRQKYCVYVKCSRHEKTVYDRLKYYFLSQSRRDRFKPDWICAKYTDLKTLMLPHWQLWVIASCSRLPPPPLHLTLPPAGEAFNYDTKYTRSTALPSLLESTTKPEPEPEPDSDSDWLVSDQTKSWTHVCVTSWRVFGFYWVSSKTLCHL